MTTVMYGPGVSAPNVPWVPRPAAPGETPLLPAFSVVPASVVVVLEAKLTLLQDEVKRLKDRLEALERKSKRARRKR